MVSTVKESEVHCAPVGLWPVLSEKQITANDKSRQQLLNHVFQSIKIVDEIVCPILGLKLIVFAGFTFTYSLMMTNPDAEPISIAVVFAALLSYFGLQAVLILIYMASVL